MKQNNEITIGPNEDNDSPKFKYIKHFDYKIYLISKFLMAFNLFSKPFYQPYIFINFIPSIISLKSFIFLSLYIFFFLL